MKDDDGKVTWTFECKDCGSYKTVRSSDVNYACKHIWDEGWGAVGKESLCPMCLRHQLLVLTMIERIYGVHIND